MNDNTLLAFLLALTQTQTDITDEKKAAFRKLSHKLYLEPDDEEGLQTQLQAILKEDPTLQQAYQTYKNQLANFLVTAELWPTADELKQARSPNRTIRNFGPPPGVEEVQGNEIANISVTAETVLLSDQPAETAKGLLRRFLDELKKCLPEE